jgi:predicted transcriptional regulator
MDVTLTSEQQSTLDEIAAARELSRDEVVQQALEAYLDFEQEQRAKIKAGIAAADRGDFASEAEVHAAFGRYGWP